MPTYMCASVQPAWLIWMATALLPRTAQSVHAYYVNCPSQYANISRCLVLQDPKLRWTASQLLQHPFIRKFGCVEGMAGLMQDLAAAMGPCMTSPRA